MYKTANEAITFKITIGDQLKTSGGTNIVIECPVSGYPILKLLWTRGDKTLHPSAKILIDVYTKTLTIKKADEWDSGKYSCFAANGAGIAMSTSIIEILREFFYFFLF